VSRYSIVQQDESLPASYPCSSAFIYNQMLNFKFSILNCGTFLI
jgi:hypothetical protein